MIKQDILSIGIGRCGNNLLNTLLSKDKRYLGLFVNSSLNDMVSLSNYERSANFLFPNTDGSGKNRDLADDFAKNNIHIFADIIMRYKQIKLFTFFFSFDGGTGSGSASRLIQATKRLFPDKKIMVVGVLPRNNSSKISLENSISCWNDIMSLKKDKIINTIKLIDNDACNSYDEINSNAINDLDTSFSLNNFDISGAIDQNDSFRINTADGYSILLNLNNNHSSIEDAIEEAKEKSVFIIPRNITECDYLGMLLQDGRYNVNESKDLFDVYKADFCGNSNGRNIIAIGGLEIPLNKIKKLKSSLHDLESKSSRRKESEEQLFIDEYSVEKDIKEEKKVEVKSNTPTSADLERIFNDDFWN